MESYHDPKARGMAAPKLVVGAGTCESGWACGMSTTDDNTSTECEPRNFPGRLPPALFLHTS